MSDTLLKKLTPETPQREAGWTAPPCSAIEWRDPEGDPPKVTGTILVITWDFRPALVNIEERWMCYTDGFDETEAAMWDEWRAWAEIPLPQFSSQNSGISSA